MTKQEREKSGPKLSAEQRDQLLEWLAADYSSTLILAWATAKKWPRITKQAISYHRRECIEEIKALRKARHEAALNSGLALREERVRRLMEHADELHEIMWEPDPKTGKYHNEKAWRETLMEIAKQKGELVMRQEHTGKDGGPIQFQRAEDLSDDDLARIARGDIPGPGGE